jgi:predicted aspartyl protease
MTASTLPKEDAMGRVVVEFKVANNQDLQVVNRGLGSPDQVRWFQLEGVVDTGATHLVLPTDVADRLGFPPGGETLIRYGDHRQATRKIVEEVRVELLGRQGTYRAILEPDRTTALIGTIVLEDLDFVVDCKNQRLQPRDPERIISEMD